MSTNYYMIDKVGIERIHLGQVNTGWKFLFRGDYDRAVNNTNTWLDQLNYAKYIINEYGKVIDAEDFLQTVEYHIGNGRKRPVPRGQIGEHYWTDRYGNLFCDLDFS